MHRILTIVFLCISAALSWWALELQGKLVLKEKELLSLRKERDAALAAEKTAKSESAPLQENIARLTKERDEARSSKPADATAAATGSQPAVGDVNAGLLGGLIQQMDSPEMKKMMRTQQLASTRKEYAALMKRWNLSPTDAETVLNFLADREMGGASEALSLLKGDATEESAKNVAEAIKRNESESKERLKAILGEDKLKELEAFDADRERQQVVSRYSEHLDITGFPLNPDQKTKLADIIRGETKVGQEAEDLKVFTSGGPSAESIAAMKKRNEDRQSRIIQKANGLLSPDQVNGLQSAFREENEEQEAGMSMVQQMFKSGGGTPGVKVFSTAPKVEIRTQVIPSK